MKKLMEGWREYERKVLTEEESEGDYFHAPSNVIRRRQEREDAIAADPEAAEEGIIDHEAGLHPMQVKYKDMKRAEQFGQQSKRKWWQKLLGIDHDPIDMGDMTITAEPPKWEDPVALLGDPDIDDAALSGAEFSTRYGFTRAEAGHDAVQDRLDYLDAHPDVWDETME